MKRLRVLAVFALVLALAFSPALADSSRRLPAAYNVTTLGKAALGRNYTTLQAWEDATDNDLVAAARGEVLDCYPDYTSYDMRVTISGATANSGYFRVVRAAPGFEGQVVFDYLTAVTTGVFGIASETNVGLYDITIKTHATYSNTLATVQLSSGATANIVGCVLGPSVNSGSGDMIGLTSLTGTSFNFVNGVIRGHKKGAFVAAGTTTTRFYNSVIYAISSIGLYVSSSTAYTRNTILQNCLTFYVGGLNSSSDLLSGGAVFVDAANGDFRLSSTDVNAKDHGISLATDTTFAFTDDVDGEARPYGTAWDIGIDEYRPPTGGAGVWCVN